MEIFIQNSLCHGRWLAANCHTGIPFSFTQKLPTPACFNLQVHTVLSTMSPMPGVSLKGFYLAQALRLPSMCLGFQCVLQHRRLFSGFQMPRLSVNQY